MTRQPPRVPPPLTVAQAAEQLGVDNSQVYHWIRAGLLASIQYPGRGGTSRGPRRIEQADVDAFKARHRQPAST